LRRRRGAHEGELGDVWGAAAGLGGLRCVRRRVCRGRGAALVAARLVLLLQQVFERHRGAADWRRGGAAATATAAVLRLYCECTARGDDKCEGCASVECGWNAGLLLLLPYPQRGLISAKPLSKAGSLHRRMAALTPMTRAHGSGEYYKGKASQAAAQPPSSISEPAPLIHLTSHLPAPKTHRRFVFFLHSFINTCLCFCFFASLGGALVLGPLSDTTPTYLQKRSNKRLHRRR
jgi:hypothetical protein